MNWDWTPRFDGIWKDFQDDGNDDIRGDVLERFRAGLAAGIGLARMRERLAELGGTLEVETDRSGSTLRATLPTSACDPRHAESVEALDGRVKFFLKINLTFLSFES